MITKEEFIKNSGMGEEFGTTLYERMVVKESGEYTVFSVYNPDSDEDEDFCYNNENKQALNDLFAEGKTKEAIQLRKEVSITITQAYEKITK